MRNAYKVHKSPIEPSKHINMGLLVREGKGKVWIRAKVRQAEAYPGFCSMKRLGVFLLPLDETLVRRRVNPSIKFVIPIYTPGSREALSELRCVLPKNTIQCPQPGLEPGPLDPETSTLNDWLGMYYITFSCFFLLSSIEIGH